MRSISAILIVSLGYAFAHEAACHEGAEQTASSWLSHSGSQHDHDSHADHRHHSEEAGHNSDHHDAETHDHLSDVVPAKKDPSLNLRVLPDLVSATIIQISAGLNLGVEPFGLYTGTYVSGSSLPAYLRAHVLLL